MVTGMGLTVLDILTTTDSLNLTRKNLVSFEMTQIGGVIPTALILLSRLGEKTELHTVLGNDQNGQTLMKVLGKEKIETKRIAVIEGKATPVAFVVIKRNSGDRTIFYTSDLFTGFNFDSVNFTPEKETKLLLIDGHNVGGAIRMIKPAKSSGIPVMLDFGNPKKELEDLVPLTDIAIVPGAYWKIIFPALSPEETIKTLLSRGPKTVILTMEDKGCVVGTKDNIFYQPGFKVSAKDTNGAGDVFFGTVAYGLVNSWDIKKIARYAAAAAARSCTILGKDNKIPHSVNEIEKFISENQDL